MPVMNPIHFDHQWRNFRLAVARNQRQRNAAYQLRHTAFAASYPNSQEGLALDIDTFDPSYDHLLVVHVPTGELVATARVAAHDRVPYLYAATEFHLAELFNQPGTILEVGRTCLKPGWRNNLALLALARAIIAYADHTSTRWLTGCTSIPTTDLRHAALLCRYFNRCGYQLQDIDISPLATTQFPFLEEVVEQMAIDVGISVPDLVPPLMRSYLRAGAKVAPLPALDRAFGCIDFYTVLDRTAANDALFGRMVKQVALVA